MGIIKKNFALNVSALGAISKDEFNDRYKDLYTGNINELWLEVVEAQKKLGIYELVNTPKESIEDNNGQDSKSKSRKSKSSKSSRKQD